MKRFKEILKYREMIKSLIRKDLRGRYKGSVLGFLWTFINPLLQLCVYTVVFSTIMKSEVKNFHIFLFVALIPWLFFSASLTGGATSVVSQKDLIKKIYFPREVLPIAYVTSSFVNMLLCFIIIFAILFISDISFNFIALLYLPIIMLVEYILALGIAMLTSALTVYLRDLEHILGIIAMAWMYLTPVLYSEDMIPSQYTIYFNLNPMSPIIKAYREILYYGHVPNISTLLHAILLGITFLVIGNICFAKLQRHFVEEL